MHITILALGSRGDVLPCLTLAKKLHTRGHSIRFATFSNFAPLIHEGGLAFHPVRGDIEKILQDSLGQRFIQAERNPLRMVTALRAMFAELSESLAEDILSPSLFDTDLILNQLPGGLFGHSLAEKAGVPMILVSVMPLTPTHHQPFFAFPSSPSFLPGYNTLTYWLGYQLVWQMFRRTITRWRLDVLRLSKAPFWGFMRQMNREAVPVLNGFSRHVVPRPSDWEEHIHITGYWFPPNHAWQPPDPLRNFIESGRPPIFVGFGSMPLRDPKRTTRIVLDALEHTGQRAILHSGWGELGQSSLPGNVHHIEYAPYAWLFPRMAAIVHHGGSGTTGFALRAGIPSLVVPFVFDQFYWGKRIHRLGVGPKPIPYSKLSSPRLASALEVALNDTQIRQRAVKLGEKIREEAGVHTAVELIINQFDRSSEHVSSIGDTTSLRPK